MAYLSKFEMEPGRIDRVYRETEELHGRIGGKNSSPFPFSRFLASFFSPSCLCTRGKLEDPSNEELAGELDLHTSTGLDRVGSS